MITLTKTAFEEDVVKLYEGVMRLYNGVNRHFRLN